MDSKETTIKINKPNDEVDEELNLKKLIKRREAMKAYKKEHEFYQQQFISSFGKLAKSSLGNSPKYSIGKDARKSFNIDQLGPGPMYSQEAGAKFKYKSVPKWKIGTSVRTSLSSNERFEHYEHVYDVRDDFSLLPKKWANIEGGAITLEKKIKLELSERTPGPGRYDPNYKPVLVKSPSCLLGAKLQSAILINKTGTGDNVAPWSYKQDNLEKLSRYEKCPKFSFQQAKRSGPGFKVWTKQESYCNYSSLGDQIMSHKSTSSLKSFGRETRDDRNKCGILKVMMQNSPSSVPIPLPKF